MQSHVGHPLASVRAPLGQARKQAIAGHTGGGHFVIVQPHVPVAVGPHTGPATEPSLHSVEGTPGAGPHCCDVHLGGGAHAQVPQPFASVWVPYGHIDRGQAIGGHTEHAPVQTHAPISLRVHVTEKAPPPEQGG
jgi:hypothetical protein